MRLRGEGKTRSSSTGNCTFYRTHLRGKAKHSPVRPAMTRFYPTHLREGKTPSLGEANLPFYPTRFRGKAKQIYPVIIANDFTRRTSGEGKTAWPPWGNFTPRSSGGKAKLIADGTWGVLILTDALPGEGKTAEASRRLCVGFYPKPSGKAKRATNGILPTLFRGEGKTTPYGFQKFYPTLFRGEGKTSGIARAIILPDALPGGRQNYPDSGPPCDFTRRTSGGKAKLLVMEQIQRLYFTRCSSGGKAKLICNFASKSGEQ